MPLLAASFLIGSWLLFPKMQEENEIFDPGAEEMPRVNQALRGTTLNQLFGTNRVSSNITWTKNWNVERHETSSSGGGGKGGGSGGSKQPEQPGEVTYTYTWDIQLTLGMVPDSYSLYGGWMNQQRMNDDTIASIAQDFSVLNFKSFTTVPDEATLQFTDAFYHSGAPTTNLTADNWDYWETQEGFPCRWPHVVWLGFQTLQLGNTASLPSLEWEVGPGDAKITMNSGFIDQEDFGGASDLFTPYSSEALIGDDGNKYFFANEGGGRLVSFDPITGTALVQTIGDADISAAITSLGLDSDCQGTRRGFGNIMGQNKYFVSYSQGSTTNLHNAQCIILWKINSAGAAEAVGAYEAVMGASFGEGFLPEEVGNAIAISNEGTFDDPILCFFTDQVSATIRPKIMTWPSINQMLTTANGGTGPYSNMDQGQDEWAAAIVSLQSLLGTNFGRHETYRTGNVAEKFGFFLPSATVGAGGLTWGTHFKWYISKADIGWHEDNPSAGFPDLPSSHIYNNMATYPFGWIGTINLGTVVHPGTMAVGSWSFDNNNWIDYDTKLPVVPFTNDDPASMKEGYDKDGTTQEDTSGYSPYPTIQKADSGIAQGSYVCLWGKIFDPKAANSTTGEYIGIRLFLWHPVLGQGLQMADPIEGSTLDVVDDLGASEPTRYSLHPWQVNLIWDQDTNSIYKMQSQEGAPAEVHWSLAASLDIGGVGDVLPPYVIYEILTNPVFGMGVATTDIDTSSYENALAYCRSEGTWISVQYNRESSKLSVIEELLSLYGGYMTISGGKIKFGVQDATATSERVIDNDRLVRDGDNPPVTVTISAKEDSYNKVLVNYIDRSLEYRQNQIEVNDEVDQDLHGVRKKEFPAKFVMSDQTATNLGIRALWSNLYGKDTYSWAVSYKDADLEAGDVITLVDSFHDQLQTGVDVRITRVSERKPGVIDMMGVTEIPYINTSSDGATNVTSATARDPIYGPSRIPANQWAYELPREFYGSQPKVYVGYNALSTNRGAWLYASEDGVSYAQVSAAEPFVISGILAAPLPTRPDGYLEQNVDIFLFPDTRSGFTASSPVYVNTFTFDTTGAAGRQAGLNTIIINSEAMAYQDLTLRGQNHYTIGRLYRGWGGTHIQAHNSGAYWHRHGGGIFGIEYNEDKVGTTFSYKVVPYNFAGQGVDVASVDASTYTIQGAYFRPQIQGTIGWSINSVKNGQSSVDLRSTEYIGVYRDEFNLLLETTSITLTESGDELLLDNGANVNISLAWQDAARLSGWGTQGYGAGDYGRFTADTTSTQYRVEVLSNDLSTVVRCISVSTGSWTYSADTNRADFGDWKGDLLIKVTPYNDFGDAPRTATKRLRAF